MKEKVTTKTITEKQFEELFWDLEVTLLENNVALGVIDKIKVDLKKQLVNVPIRKNKIEEAIIESLRNSIEGLFDVPQIDLIQEIKNKKEKPYIILFLGINGGGKTTSLAKVANYLIKNHLSCVLVAADTWRAASIEQLEEHAKNLGVKIVKHNYASDPAAVCFDGIKHAQAKGIDVVLIDTAGRIHSNANLMSEMEKIVRVSKPDLKIFIGESISGNDCTEQMVKFNESVNVDGAILTKADVDEKGGAAISISYVSKKPILFLGVGQKYDDLEKFDKQKIISSLGL
ncbi:signal recognition particle-docking protein FtsY [Candidatus Woesearchaeota archaeon]|nr:signal recognition particle-docking protein FtsY [Candidatus Woesearchaeota archaeon]